jgi:hypothetical protein
MKDFLDELDQELDGISSSVDSIKETKKDDTKKIENKKE